MHLFDFDTLSAGGSLLTFDQRGHGRSTGRPVAADYTFANGVIGHGRTVSHVPRSVGYLTLY